VKALAIVRCSSAVRRRSRWNKYLAVRPESPRAFPPLRSEAAAGSSP
jgi:hypothetical protein